MDNPVPETPTPPIAPPAERPINPSPPVEPQVGFPKPVVIESSAPLETLAPSSDHTSILPGSEKPKSKTNLLMIVAIVLLLLAIGVLGFFIFRNMQQKSSSQAPTPTPPILTPTPTADPTAAWEKYTNEQYGFELKYPSTYKQTEDKYGWPKSILLLYRGGQSYDLAVEVWSSELEYQTKYKTQLDVLTVKQSLGKFITFLNQNKDPEVDQIISTFKFINPTPTVNMPTASPSATPTVTP